ncbi:flavodoxin family protein [Clostridium sp. BNL1100]|uniref:flavodoxin family protein n=1 Tax=Clostridium sp. BNL1100 TaxID=755731 RepID=UPI00024A71B2|nr:flavodoxin family protein [Clostridium sp. BNL1100]AEY67194.1 multimeric flavodoxin WrbA [Clostridium sp. BNL1100]AEY67393.1 multimeric flavodoxin WrbA [Clostridium sp. BNL1100]
MNNQNIKVFVFIGSMKGKNSTEYQAILKFLNKAAWSNAEIDIVTADNADIKPCLGCCSCFDSGTCPLKLNDDILQIKQKLLDADLIIVSSPVYLHHVSGSTKTFLDRISHWAHTFDLIGKRAIVCSSTATSGNEYVISYLKKAMWAFGCLVVGEINVSLLISEEELSCQFDKIYSSLYESYKNPETCKVSIFQQQLFATLKKSYLQNTDTYESNYWKEHNLFDYPKFEDFLKANLIKDSVI